MRPLFPRFTLLLLALLLVAGCTALPLPAPETSSPADFIPEPAATATPMPLITPDPFAGAPGVAPLSPSAAAIEIAAADLRIPAAEIQVTAVEAVDWNDSSLGCPRSGMMYAQVITPGYRVTVLAGGKTYQVHMDTNGYGLICNR